MYWLPNYVSIIEVFTSTLGVIAIILSNIVASGSENASGSGTIGSGRAIRSGAISPSTNTWGPLFAFNLVVEFFQELRWNHQGVWIEKLRNLQEFHISTMKAYMKPMA